MKSETLIRNFKQAQFNTVLQSEIYQDYKARIRRTKRSYPYWELSSIDNNQNSLLALYDDMCLFGYRYRFIVEFIESVNWYKYTTWLVNIESED